MTFRNSNVSLAPGGKAGKRASADTREVKVKIKSISDKPKKIWLRVLIIFLAVVIYAGVFKFSYDHTEEVLHEERSEGIGTIMQKINDSVELGVGNRWTNVHHFANLISRLTPTGLSGVKDRLRQLQDDRPEEMSRLILVDSNGMAHMYGVDEPIAWPRTDLLTTEDEFYASSADFAMDEDRESIGDTTRMFFITPLSNQITVPDTNANRYTFTHMVLACRMSFIDSYFNTEDYGDESMAFVIRQSGEHVYKQNKDHPLAMEEDLLGALSDTTVTSFAHGSSYEQFADAINTGKAACFCVTYRGVEYYLAEHPLGSNNKWSSIMFVPQSQFDGVSREYMWGIVINTTIIILGALCVVILIFVWTSAEARRRNDLVNEQLIKAAEAERSANEAKTRFLSSMSHDIRTPMNAIMGMTALATSHIDDKKYVINCLNKATQASNHLLTLINDVLDISKVESGKMTLNPIVFSLADTITKLVNITKSNIAVKNHDFNVHIRNLKNENLFADELRINQICINLLSNAVKYTPEGGRIILDVEEKSTDKMGVARIVITVKDTGIGMTEEFMQNMYSTFTRADSEHVGNIQGTGLGLTIVHEMVTLMGGEIECRSEVGVGTEFKVTLDLPIADNITDELVLPPMQLLLVDDDDVFIETATATLRELGVAPDAVMDPEMAIALVEEKHKRGLDYNVVIVDYKMPGMDGLETTREIRRRVGNDVPIILVSAYGTAELEEEARLAGANGLISKPFFISTVYRDITEILGITEAEKQRRTELNEDDLCGMRILVAEDNDLNWEIASEILSMYGVETVRAENGRLALETVESSAEGEFDMILMDIKMPIMNGYDAAKAIRASSREYVSCIPIVAMTADAFSDDIQRAHDAGMNAHLSKPINTNALLAIIGNRGGGDQAD